MIKALVAAAIAAIISGLCTQLGLISLLWWPLLLCCAGAAFVFSYLGVAGGTMLVLGVFAVVVGLLTALASQLLFIPFALFVFGVGAVAASIVEGIGPPADG